MELALQLNYEQILFLVKQMPVNQLIKLRTDIDEKLISDKTKTELTDFQKFILNAPVMSDEQYDAYLQNRKNFNQWRSE